MKLRRLSIACMLSLEITGCGSNIELASEQLARVAKDWSLSIRASQVIPVYPLTEDLQPGDIFLVDTPIEEQVAVYQSKGFLPLENQVARLEISTTDYKSFYKGWLGVDSSSTVLPPPRLWQFPQGGLAASGFEMAPLAKFPSYSFSVSRSNGLSLALPISGVPFGLSILNSGSASGSIVMKDAYTYGLPAQKLFEKVNVWGQSVEVQSYLRRFQPKNNRSYFLRVVHRVYLAKSIDVSLLDNQGSGAAVSGGTPQSVALPPICNGIPDSSKCLETINGLISNSAGGSTSAAASSMSTPSAGGTASPPVLGGSVKVTMVSGHGLTLREDFTRPVVVGYLAFDYPVLSDGTLGGPSGTLSKLEGREQLKPAETSCSYFSDSNTSKIRDWRDKNPENLRNLNQWAQSNHVEISDLLTCSNTVSLRERAIRDLNVP